MSGPSTGLVDAARQTFNDDHPCAAQAGVDLWSDFETFLLLQGTKVARLPGMRWEIVSPEVAAFLAGKGPNLWIESCLLAVRRIAEADPVPVAQPPSTPQAADPPTWAVSPPPATGAAGAASLSTSSTPGPSTPAVLPPAGTQGVSEQRQRYDELVDAESWKPAIVGGSSQHGGGLPLDHIGNAVNGHSELTCLGVGAKGSWDSRCTVQNSDGSRLPVGGSPDYVVYLTADCHTPPTQPYDCRGVKAVFVQQAVEGPGRKTGPPQLQASMEAFLQCHCHSPVGHANRAVFYGILVSADMSSLHVLKALFIEGAGRWLWYAEAAIPAAQLPDLCFKMLRRDPSLAGPRRSAAGGARVPPPEGPSAAPPPLGVRKRGSTQGQHSQERSLGTPTGSQQGQPHRNRQKPAQPQSSKKSGCC